ncbi:hypothetical protein [Dentiradicibacter hellwigii]|uniref:Secreted protein n=1 Tax=Dentiradicibacter hellwigii TaxID=3149053 RepID=A0ABV4UEW4_9RHOO
MMVCFLYFAANAVVGISVALAIVTAANRNENPSVPMALPLRKNFPHRLAGTVDAADTVMLDDRIVFILFFLFMLS